MTELSHDEEDLQHAIDNHEGTGPGESVPEVEEIEDVPTVNPDQAVLGEGE